MPHHRRITVDDAGGRLDHVLAQWLALSRRQAIQLLERGCVRVNDRTVSHDAKGRHVMVDDRIDVEPFDRPEAQRAIAQPGMDLDVVSEGPGWIIVNKPPHVGVHPLRPEQKGTLLNAAVARYPQIHGVGEAGLRSGVVHRLDVTTSGCVVLALDEAQWQRLRDAFRSRRVRKVYRAIVHGRLEGESRETLPLIVRQHHPARVAVARSTRGAARRCSLRWRALDTSPDATLVEIELETGFLHQIRVMLAHLGHPIVGDAVYGPDALPAAAHAATPAHVDRPMLHALELAFEEVQGKCDPPVHFSACWRDCRGSSPHDRAGR